jgi:type III restriction enzyme
VLAVIRTTAGELRALDLTADGIAEKVAAATNRDLMEVVFAAEGVGY